MASQFLFFAPISVRWDVLYVDISRSLTLLWPQKGDASRIEMFRVPARRYAFRIAVQLTFVGWHMRRDGALEMLCTVLQTIKLGFHSRAQTVKHYHDGMSNVILWPTARRMALDQWDAQHPCHRGVVTGHRSPAKVCRMYGQVLLELESCECLSLRPPGPVVYI